MALLSPKYNSLGQSNKKKRKQNKEIFEKQTARIENDWSDVPKFSGKYGPVRNLKNRSSKIPSYKIPENRDTKHIPSRVELKEPSMVLRRSPMDPRELAKEDPKIQEATIAKSQSIAPMYNKGGGQYVTPGIDVTTIGSRSRRP